jgi:hypothetical protein
MMLCGVALIYTLLEILKALGKERYVESWGQMSDAELTIISDIKAAAGRRRGDVVQVTFLGVRLKSIVALCKRLGEATYASDWGKRKIDLKVFHIHPDFVKHSHFVQDDEFNDTEYRTTLKNRESEIKATFRAIDSINVEVLKYKALPHIYGVLINESMPVCYIGVYQWDFIDKRWSSERNWCAKLGNHEFDQRLIEYFTDRCALLEELSEPKSVDSKETQPD